MFQEKDITQIANKGLSIKQVQEQIQLFKQGLPFVNLKSAATSGKGILKLSEAERQGLIDLFDVRRNSNSILKFVPASGAATRMFKSLFICTATMPSKKNRRFSPSSTRRKVPLPVNLTPFCRP